jgi:hypothetical protein
VYGVFSKGSVDVNFLLFSYSPYLCLNSKMNLGKVKISENRKVLDIPSVEARQRL